MSPAVQVELLVALAQQLPAGAERVLGLELQPVSGDRPWRRVALDFDVEPGLAEVELACELEATAGEAWFDAASLKLSRRAP